VRPLRIRGARARLPLCCADERLALLGAMQSLFEGSMYTFIFLWTPALSPRGERLPHGMTSACFMVASVASARPAARCSGCAWHCLLVWHAAEFACAAVATQVAGRLSSMCA